MGDPVGAADWRGSVSLVQEVLGFEFAMELIPDGMPRPDLRREKALAATEFHHDLDREARLEFLQGLSVVSVPAARGEAFGLHLIEAMAAGVPVVQPAAGAYPEIVRATGGGVLIERAQPDLLAAAVARLLQDPEQRRACGRRGRASVQRQFSVEQMAARVVALYLEVANCAK